MAEAAAHLTDHVFPRLPVRQWVLSVPKRLRYYLQRDKGALNAALRIFLRVVQAPRIAPARGPPLWDAVVRRRRVRVWRVWRLSRTGIWQPSQHQTTPTISALPGEFATW